MPPVRRRPRSPSGADVALLAPSLHPTSGVVAAAAADATDSSSETRSAYYIAISYALEWVFFFSVIIIPLYVAVYYIPFRVRSVSLTDSTLAQPYVEKDSLPILFVFETSIIVPLIFFHLYPFLLAKFWWKAGLPKHEYSFKYSYWWSVCIIHTVGLTVLLSELSKRLVQAPRPDFIWRCFPGGVPEEVREKAQHNFWMFHTDLCTPKTRDFLEDGMQSFPSEHTSLAWCMCSVLILFFVTIHEELLLYSTPMEPIEKAASARRLTAAGGAANGDQHAARALVQPEGGAPAVELTARPGPNLVGGAEPEQAPAVGQLAPPPSVPTVSSPASPLSLPGPHHRGAASFWPTSHVVFIAHVILPFGWAVAVGFSRTFDHRHHVQDVLAGALLGVGVAYAVYKVHLAKFTGYHRRWAKQQAAATAAAAAEAVAAADEHRK